MTRIDERESQAIRDMILAGETILHYTRGGRTRFLKDQLTQDAVVRRFEIMGEAARRISEATRKAHQGVPWRSIAAFRNVLIHAYDSLVAETIWGVVAGPLKDALPALRAMLEE